MSITVELVAHGDEVTCGKAARVCTSPDSVHVVFNTLPDDEATRTLDRALAMGHESVSEHLWLTFLISGISRAGSHQLVRHRLASYSQQSQRCVEEQDFQFVVPPSIANKANKDALSRYNKLMESIRGEYLSFVRHYKIPSEDARFVLPNAATTQLVMTMNARTLLHFLAERTCSTAQWEIRDAAKKMLALAQKAAPTIFANAGPKCHYQCWCTESKKKWEQCKRRPHRSDMVLLTTESANVRRRALNQLVAGGTLTEEQAEDWRFTCDGCFNNSKCKLAFDLYNIQGDCLAEK